MKHEFTYVVWKIDAAGEITTSDPYVHETFKVATSLAVEENAVKHAEERIAENYPVIDCAGYLAILTDSKGDEIWSEKRIY